MGDFKQCIEVSKKALAVNDSLAGAYYNIGLAYFNQAVEMDKNSQQSRKTHQEIDGLYNSAMPYLQKISQCFSATCWRKYHHILVPVQDCLHRILLHIIELNAQFI